MVQVVSGSFSRLSESVNQVAEFTPASMISQCAPGTGIAIVSTSKGVLSNREARKQRLGGEVICTVW